MMRRFGLPVLPLILGVIIGPRAERQLRRVLQLSGGEISGLWSEPLAVAVCVVIATVLLPLARRLLRGRGGPSPGADVRGEHAGVAS